MQTSRKILRRGQGEGKILSPCRMGHCEGKGVEHDPGGKRSYCGRCVGCVPKKRVPQMCHVHAYLMGATRVYVYAHKGSALVLCHPQSFEGCPCLASALGDWHAGHARLVHRVPSYAHLAGAGLGRLAGNYGKVDFANLSFRKGFGQKKPCPLVPCDNQKAACLLVKAVHYAWPQSPHCAKFRIAGIQAPNECVRGTGRAGVHCKPRLLGTD